MTLVEVIAGFLAVYGPNPVPFGANAGSTSSFIPGPGLLPTSAQDVDGFGCFLYNALYADFFGEFFNIINVVAGGVNTILGLLDPALSDFVGCTPNFPDETAPNSYGGALAYMQATSGAPGAPKSAPCLLGSNSECIADTNTYGVTESDYVGNKYEFTGTAEASEDPMPSGPA
jgi:hypothetical protein